VSGPDASAGDETAGDETAAAALQDALATEHAALWSYGLVLPFLPPELAEAARTDAVAHRERREATEQVLIEMGHRPVPAQPAYRTPQPVTDEASATRLAVVAETDALAAWRSVTERTGQRRLRQAALDALVDGTRRCARWRQVAGDSPAVPIFPGLA
jgi:hypothetical protein